MKFVDKRLIERKVLQSIYHLALEDLEHATYARDVQNATGLGAKELQDVCKVLQKSGYIERSNFRIAITEDGVAYAEKLIEQA